MITGKITLSNVFEDLSVTKTYNGKGRRNDIIKTWDNFYALKNNNKAFFIDIAPDIPECEELISGYVTITSEKHYDRKFYRSKSHRDKIINEFVNQYKLTKYCLEIQPN